MCRYCNPDYNECEYWVDNLTGDFYHEIRTDEWDAYDDDYVYLKKFGVHFCEYCGQELSKIS